MGSVLAGLPALTGPWHLAAAALGLYAAFVTVVGPALLARGTWWSRHPSLALGVWFGAAASGAVAVSGALVLSCVSLLDCRHASTPYALVVATEVAVWLVVAVTVALLARCLSRLDRVVFANRDLRDHMDEVAALLGSRTSRRGDVDVVVLRTDRVVACAVPGRRGRVYVSEGVVDALGATELDAVLAHEVGHLRGRHAWLTGAAHALAVAVPVRASRRLRSYVELLVELAADDRACRSAGHGATCSAMRRLADLQADRGEAGSFALRASRLASFEAAGNPVPAPAVVAA
ncbi:M56 family metallopeptidase [Nocardioides zeae]|uniref:M56 family metallopeptidase n=1 Tax=Nocardioides imazamoxiresistens TaxID=3231893 RepID=A0ABU3PTH5_9ACTN|nr:M56 family metallopeptidase [Nocardioides zeae]MDT9592532.1 M56 family metallopeptidase [Nocardioides zeae]